jgi:hypothetical protein
MSAFSILPASANLLAVIDRWHAELAAIEARS